VTGLVLPRQHRVLQHLLELARADFPGAAFPNLPTSFATVPQRDEWLIEFGKVLTALSKSGTSHTYMSAKLILKRFQRERKEVERVLLEPISSALELSTLRFVGVRRTTLPLPQLCTNNHLLHVRHFLSQSSSLESATADVVQHGAVRAATLVLAGTRHLSVRTMRCSALASSCLPYNSSWCFVVRYVLQPPLLHSHSRWTTILWPTFSLIWRCPPREALQQRSLVLTTSWLRM
jgi:hypothetical protein